MSKPPNAPTFRLLKLGVLPCKKVGEILKLPMSPGFVHCSVGAQMHAYRIHGPDFMICHAYLSQTVTAPTYIGKGPNQDEGFEMILDVPDQDLSVLVAILLRPSNDNIYSVKSCYPISEHTLERRLRKGFLFRA